MHEALQAAEEAEKDGISVEIVDPRTLLPLDEETIVASVRKTTRCVTAHEAVTRGGFGAELAAIVQHGAFDWLDAPIERVGARFAPLPFAPVMEQWVVPHAADVLDAVRRTVAMRPPLGFTSFDALNASTASFVTWARRCARVAPRSAGFAAGGCEASPPFRSSWSTRAVAGEAGDE